VNPEFVHATTPLEKGTTVIAASAGTGKTSCD
jgi:ATP-dependent exoDNAse (exonuclease V) beta subunit